VEWVALALLAAAVVAATVLVATGRFEPTPLSEPTSTRPPLEIPEHPSSTDVDGIRLGTSVYGYVPQDVDAALDARQQRLADQERALAHQGQAHAHQELAHQEQALADRDGHVHPHA
jgi:hypothetical protein